MRLLISTLVVSVSFFASSFSQSDPPVLSAWLRNTNGRVGYNNLPADVQQVRFSTNWVYSNSSNIPTNQNYQFKISRNPVENTGTKISTPLGVIAFWKNGVSIYNALDAMSYNNQNIWHQNAVVVEAPSFDACLGHPAQQGRYHNHQNPRCLYNIDSTRHSPLLGYAYDGFPIYGPYGFVNTNGTGGITRIKSSYRTRSITQRTTLPDGTVLQPSQYGPNVSTTYPHGYYAEDYEYVSGLGDLDAYNGRFCVTPEYPGGVYTYVVTTNANGSSAYPYVIGPKYYGIVATENITTQGHVTISEPVTVYNPTSAVGEQSDVPTKFELKQNYPNPFNPTTEIRFQIAEVRGQSEGLLTEKSAVSRVTLKVYDVLGKEFATLVNEVLQPGEYSVGFDASRQSSGVYYYRLETGGKVAVKKMALLR